MKPLCTLVVLRPLKSSGHKISQNWLRLARPSQSQTVSRKKQKKIVDHENGPKSPELSREHVDPKKQKNKKNMELPLQCRHKTDKRPELLDQTFFIYIF